MRASKLLPAIPAVLFVTHAVTATRYGYFRDELYYIACTDHLSFGYVDHPPLSILLLWLVRRTLGDSLHAIRLLPALAAVATIVLTGAIARRMGGGVFARALAMLAATIPPLYLFVGHVYSMNAFDMLAWSAATLLLVRIFEDGSPRLWILLGVVLGLGLENKISVLWLGFGLVIALRLTRQRGWLMTPWPWISGAIALLLFTPHVAWQIAHGWPTLEFMRNAARLKMATHSPWGFLAAQALLVNPLSVIVAVAGLLWLLLGEGRKNFVALALIFLVVLALLLAFPSSKPDYLGPAYALLLAAGGVALERRIARVGLRAAALALLVLGGALLAPFALPVLPADTYVSYARTLGVAPGSAERHELGTLPQHYADMHGWESIVATLAHVFEQLPAEERARAGIFAQNYGEAAAIDFFGPRYGLPRAVSGHNSYWLWGPGSASGEVLIVLGGDREDNAEVCEELTEVATTDCGLCMPYENQRSVYVCRRLRPPLRALWPRLKRYV